MENKKILAENWGIEADADSLIDWQASMKTYETLWIREENQDANPGEFIQDIFLWATYFIWIVVTVALVVSALMLIFASWDEKFAEKWKSGIKYSMIWLLLVIFSYSIIRAIQLLAAW